MTRKKKNYLDWKIRNFVTNRFKRVCQPSGIFSPMWQQEPICLFDWKVAFSLAFFSTSTDAEKNLTRFQPSELEGLLYLQLCNSDNEVAAEL